jgi:hypothetical protein
MISAGLVTSSYIAATILFILALGGLSNQETARRGNWYGIIGMTLALVATVLGVVTQHHTLLIIMLLIGGSIGLVLAPGANDADARARCDPAQPGRPRRRPGRLRQLHGPLDDADRRRGDDP